MDNRTTNTSQIPCQSWVNQNVWSTASAQGALLNTPSSSQHLGLSSDKRGFYDHLQVSSQSCVSDLNNFSSGNKTSHSNPYKPFYAGSGPSPATLFNNTGIQNTSNVMSFNHHTSSMLLNTNKGKTLPQPSHFQQNQGLETQPLAFLSSQNAYIDLCQPPVTNHSLPHGLQDLSTTLPSCGQAKAIFDGANMESAHFSGSIQRNASSSSQEKPQWTPSTHITEAVDKSVPDATADPNNEQEGTITPLTNGEKQRSAILHQRAQLLKQLAEMEKLLETMPQDESCDELSPCDTSVKSPTMDDSFHCKQTETTDAEQDQPAEKSESLSAEDCSSHESCDEQEQETSDVPDDQMFSGESEDNTSSESDDDLDSNYGPIYDDDFPSDTDEQLSDDSTHSSCSGSGDETPTQSNKKKAKSGNSLHKEKIASPAKNTCKTNPKPSGTIVLPNIDPKERGYTKKNYCLFCSQSVTKMARHLERIHSDRAEVAVAFQFPKKSKERKKIWNKLINEGNFEHNKEVLKTGNGSFAVRKTPKQESKATDFVHCLYCRGLYLKKGLSKHLKNCPEKKKNENEARLGRRSLTVQCVLEALGDIGISDGFRSILCGMIYDDVTQAIINDQIILQFGEQMFIQYGSNLSKHGYIKQNLRHLGRLVLKAAKTTPLKNLEEFFYLSSFRHVVSAVNDLAGYDPESKTFRIPSLALKLGYHLQKACSIVQENAMKCGDDSLVESTRKFLSVYEKKWNKLISLDALTTLKETKLITDTNVPNIKHVKSLYFHLENVHLVAEKKLRERPSTENYSALAKVILARTIFFNKRKGQEVSRIQIAQFESRKKSNIVDDMDITVSDFERTMCSFFSRIDIRGTSGRIVPVILKPSFVSALELLVDIREKCGVSSKNIFLFGRPHALTSYRATETIQNSIKECGIKSSKELILPKILKHYGTMLQIMTLDEDEAYQILGPNNKVQTLREDSNMQLEDVEKLLEVILGLQNRDKQLSTNQAAYGEIRMGDEKLHEKKGHQIKDKHKWGEAEVRAVERHMMRFIRGHRVPQKDDCLKCLVAEPDALKKRTWKGVKDYVRNRIITLKRQGSSSKGSSTKGNRPRQEKQPNVTHCTTDSPGTAPSKSIKSRDKGPKNKNKHKWGDAEVQAVERHMMRFIQGHKVPQKNDCLECIAAEANALKKRTWKGVKDYVRNRIISLKRLGSSPRDLFTSVKKPRNVKSKRETPRTTQAQVAAPPKSVKAKEKGLQSKDRHKWGEAEVRAVERHMMRFIQGHKVPQKNDCLECIAAEPNALSARTWKGVKDYVRNRITSLKRQNGTSWDY